MSHFRNVVCRSLDSQVRCDGDRALGIVSLYGRTTGGIMALGFELKLENWIVFIDLYRLSR
jgi:hypothetical protein